MRGSEGTIWEIFPEIALGNHYSMRVGREMTDEVSTIPTHGALLSFIPEHSTLVWF
jgi:hypothetical protein